MKLLYEKIAIVFQNFKQYAVTLKENITLDRTDEGDNFKVEGRT